MAGYDSTIGLAQFIDQPLGQDCSFVAGLKELHGLPFCLTNVPQTMLSWSCSNPVYGNTANPHDKTRSFLLPFLLFSIILVSIQDSWRLLRG